MDPLVSRGLGLDERGKKCVSKETSKIQYDTVKMLKNICFYINTY